MATPPIYMHPRLEYRLLIIRWQFTTIRMDNASIDVTSYLCSMRWHVTFSTARRTLPNPISR